MSEFTRIPLILALLGSLALPTVGEADWQYETELVQGSAKCIVALWGTESGPNLSYVGRLYAPNGTQIGPTASKQTYGYKLGDSFSRAVATSGTYTCRVEYYVDAVRIGTDSVSRYFQADPPSSLAVVTPLTNQSGTPPECSGKKVYYFKYRDYEVRNGANQSIRAVMFADESFTMPTNTCNVARFVERDGNTTSDGRFRDNYYLCGIFQCDVGGSCTVKRVQNWKIDGVPVTPQFTMNYTCSTFTITP